MTEKWLPHRYIHSVIPHIMIKGASTAIEFYKRAFDAVEIFRIAKPDGKIIHAEITIGDSIIMVGDAEGIFHDPQSLGGSSVGLHIYIDKVDDYFAQAVHAGAEPLQPVQDMFYGDRMGILKDPFGHIWVLLTHKEDVTPEEIKRRGEAMLGQETMMTK
jgi:PhnB protein